MKSCFCQQGEIEIVPVIEADFSTWCEMQTDFVKAFMGSQQFKAQTGQVCLVPNESGSLAFVAVGMCDADDVMSLGVLPRSLPEGDYLFAASDDALYAMSLAWGMGAYQFTRYKKGRELKARLAIAECVDQKQLQAELDSVYLLRDLINTPTDDMGPHHLSKVVADMAAQFKADFNEIVGDDLLAQNFPLIHAVGRAATKARAPRLLELNWGDDSHKTVTLVGKGVCYDTGGLSLKPSRSMVLMKKDMGGSAHVIALARYIMAMNLPIRLRLLVPAVENAVSSNSIRPGDVVTSRKGISVEITNTDAEGRLILADALAFAAETNPDLLIDMATLTGAARVAMGPDVTPFMTDDVVLSRELQELGAKANDPMWPLPLYRDYMRLLKSDVADCDNASTSGYAGCILAGIFLQQFVGDCRWLHVDVFGWRNETRGAYIKGGDAFALRALMQVL